MIPPQVQADSIADDPLDAILAKRKQDPHQDASVDPLDAILAKRTKAQQPSKVGHLEGMLSAATHTLPGADDVSALVGAIGKGSLSNFGQNFLDARTQSVQRNKQYESEHPYASKTGALLGQVATLPLYLESQGLKAAAAARGAVSGAVESAAGPVQNFLRSVGHGAAAGSVMGAANSDDPSFWGRVGGGTAGAVQGGVFGGLLHPVAGQAAKYALGDDPTVAQATGQRGKVNKTITKDLATEGQTPSVLERVPQDRGEIGADISPALRQSTAEVARFKTPESARLRQTVQERDVAAPGRLAQDVSAVHGTPAGDPARAEINQLALERNRIADRAFPAAYATGTDIGANPVVQRFFQTPMGKTILGRVMESAANEPRKLPTVEVSHTEPVGPKTLMGGPPAPLGAPPVAPVEPKFQNPIVQAMVDKAETPALRAQIIQRLIDQQAPQVGGTGVSGPPVPPADQVTVTRNRAVPDMKGMHYALQVADDMINSGYSEKNVRLLPEDAVNLERFIEAVKGQIASASPEMAGAMRKYGDLSNQIRARNTGLGFRQYATTQGPEGSVPPFAMGDGVPRDAKGARTGLAGLEQGFGAMQPSERAGAQTGMVQALRDELSSVPRRSGAGVKALHSFPESPEGDRLRQLLGTPEGVQQLTDAIARERAMSETASRMPDYGTQAEPNPVDDALSGAAHSRSVTPTHMAAYGLKQALSRRILGQPQVGPLAEALTQPPSTLAQALRDYGTGRQRLQSTNDLFRTPGLLATLSQFGWKP